ncbi:MAG: CDP-alcohol phosphatidyltransferase family protein [Planctomycetota bacterium]|jgi:CDP-diacylglycerol--glycerol-3-phosphate 3-phosphatidyltransferase
MNWKLPNQLTASRLPLSAAFFVLVGLYSPSSQGQTSWLLIGALAVFAAAGVTDFLDGYLARKMNITSAFGRMVDPFVDKVLIVGAFVMLAGPNYIMPAPILGESFEWELPAWLTGRMVSAIQPWMVVAIMAREFVVSAVRGYSESQGIKFPATSAGKIKMVVQLFAIGTILVQLGFPVTAPWAVCLKVFMVWLAVVATVFSGLIYIGRARTLLMADE